MLKKIFWESKLTKLKFGNKWVYGYSKFWVGNLWHLKISESAAVQMPMKTVASLITIIAIGTWAYFGIHEKLNQHSTKIELMQKDLDQNSEFRIKYPRGELGQSAGEAELFMIVEHVSGLLEDVEEEIKGMRNNAVNIEFLKKRTEEVN